MTRPTQEQMKALFGKPGAFDVFFIAKPRSMAQVIDAFLDEPGVVDAVGNAIKQIYQERKTRPSSPTLCLLCDRNFLACPPAVIVLAAPSTRLGPAAAFAICERCAGKGRLEERVRAYLAEKLGMQATAWGTA